MGHSRRKGPNGRALARIGDERQEMEMTPMIDVTFLLLVFFMCTLQFKTLEGTLQTYLPKDIGTGRAMWENPRIELRVVEEGTRVRFDPEVGRERPVSAAELADGRRFSFGADRVIEYTIGSYVATDLRDVADHVARVDAAERAAGRADGVTVEVDARRGTIQGDVVAVLDMLRGLGVTQVRITGERGR